MHIEFLGAAQEVTGSCFLIEVNEKRILVDCGMIQGGRKDEARNRKPFPFKPSQIDAVFLSHGHLDHSGRLPLLVKQGFRGRIYTHRATVDLCKVLLLDAASLSVRDAEWESKKRARRGMKAVEPLYTVAEAEKSLKHLEPLEYGERYDLLPGVTVRLRDAGHILGSAVIEMWLQEGGVERKLVFSGDLGHIGAPLLRDPEIIEEADLVIMESTYGDRCHRPWDETWDELREVLHQAREGNGNILIPAFAIGRTQELLYAMQLHYQQWGMDRWNIFLDSPMAIRATEAYARHRDVFDEEASAVLPNHGRLFNLPNLHLTETPEESMAINKIHSGAIIIAGSGMCTGGRIRHHFKHQIWRPETQVIIAGFQAAGTLGRSLVEGTKWIRLWGEQIRVAAKIHTVGGLSAHAGQRGLLDWYGAFRNRPALVLVHGEEKAMDQLTEKLQDEYTVTPLRPQARDRIDLNKGPFQLS